MSWQSLTATQECWQKYTPVMAVWSGTIGDTMVYLPNVNDDFGTWCVTDDGEVQIVDGPSAVRE